MPLFLLSKEITFPPPHLADADGLLAIGGDLSTERLLAAYRQGIFPWYNEGEEILWWSPSPRFVLFPDELHISKSMRPLLNRNEFDFTINTAFTDVIRQCQKITRPGQDNTWITGDMEKAYCRLHALGHAHSAEVWKEGVLMGGLYGIRMGAVFFGESMFSKTSNASRYAFICYVEYLKTQGVQLIDCQVHTHYLESMGARLIPGKEFRVLLKKYIS
jgi:leucyl/phenylalanyl-tRNA---protein transferase